MGADVLVFDSTRVFFVVNGPDSMVDMSADWYFDRDAMAVRIKASVTSAVPSLERRCASWRSPRRRRTAD